MIKEAALFVVSTSAVVYFVMSDRSTPKAAPNQDKEAVIPAAPADTAVDEEEWEEDEWEEDDDQDVEDDEDYEDEDDNYSFDDDSDADNFESNSGSSNDNEKRSSSVRPILDDNGQQEIRSVTPVE